MIGKLFVVISLLMFFSSAAMSEEIEVINRKCRLAFARNSESVLRQKRRIATGTRCRVRLRASEGEAAEADMIYLRPSFRVGTTDKPISSKPLNKKRAVRFTFTWSNSVCYYYLMDRLDSGEQPEPSITGLLITRKVNRDAKRGGSCFGD